MLVVILGFDTNIYVHLDAERCFDASNAGSSVYVWFLFIMACIAIYGWSSSIFTASAGSIQKQKQNSGTPTSIFTIQYSKKSLEKTIGICL